MKVEPVADNQLSDLKLATVSNCPRCHGEHDAMIFEALSNPQDEHDHFGWCFEGERMQPVLVKGSELG